MSNEMIEASMQEIKSPVERPLIILAGPTGVGKTALSIRLAKKLNGEIVSADSMQVYRHMDIGTAKITREQMEGIPHHLIDILEPEEEFNVMIFQELAEKAIREIWDRGHVPILTGGTGFYIQSVLYGIDFTEHSDDGSIRKELEATDTDQLYDMLMEVDPASCEIIHKNNRKRVIRALEYYRLTGEPISLHNAEQHEKTSRYDAWFYVLTDERSVLYSRIDARVDQMVEAGLLDEIDRLKKQGYDSGLVSMQGIGYKELLQAETSEEIEAGIEQIKLNSRHFAKRQLTWFRREQAVRWIDRSEFASEDAILDHVLEETMQLADFSKRISSET